MVFNCNPSRIHVIYSRCWHKHRAANSNTKVSHSIRVYFVILGTSLTRPFCKLTGGSTVKIFSSVKNMKSTANAGKLRISFRARVRRNAQFVTMCSCARRFFKHFNLKFWRMIRYKEEWRILIVLCKIWRVVVWVLWCTFVTQNQFIDRNNAIISARTARSFACLMPSRTASVFFFTTYSDQKPSNLCQEIF